jgi:hypothetical protein
MDKPTRLSGPEDFRFLVNLLGIPLVDEEFIASFVEESNAIEGICSNRDDLLRQIREGNSFSHAGAIVNLHQFLYEGCFLTEKLVKETQERIVGGQSEDSGQPHISLRYIGKYRDVGVAVDGKICCPPSLVEVSMKGFVESVGWWQLGAFNRRRRNKFIPKDEIERIAKFHRQFNLIHPFLDGNGRTSRALTYYMMRFAGLEPFVFTSHDKCENYYPAFASDTLMIEYFFKKTNII